MKPTHCILYLFDDSLYHPADETTGKCLDVHDKDMNCLLCADVIAAKRCPKGRKTPVY